MAFDLEPKDGEGFQGGGRGWVWLEAVWKDRRGDSGRREEGGSARQGDVVTCNKIIEVKNNNKMFE